MHHAQRTVVHVALNEEQNSQNLGNDERLILSDCVLKTLHHTAIETIKSVVIGLAA